MCRSETASVGRIWNFDFGGYYLNKKKKSNKSGYPDKTLARCFYPSMVEFFSSEAGQREYEEWLKEQEALQALPVAA